MVGEVRQRMVSSATRLLAERGLQATSFNEVLAASGAPHGSLYHHFPGGKQELVLASLDAAGEGALRRLAALEGRPAVEVAASFLDAWRRLLEATGCTVGCAIVAVTVAADSPVLLDRTAAVFRTWRSRLAALLMAGGVAADRADGLAAGLIAASEGAVVMARAERAIEVFELVAAEQLAVIRAAAGSDGAAPPPVR